MVDRNKENFLHRSNSLKCGVIWIRIAVRPDLSVRGRKVVVTSEIDAREIGTYLLEAVDVTKKFGDFVANDRISLRIAPGEIHALLGENGAGKSTLVKMMYGALQPTAGELKWRGKAVTILNPANARKLGIGMVFQHFSLFEALTVVENIALAIPEETDMWKLATRIRDVSKAYGLPLEPDALVADLSVGERQRIEIVRCLLQEPELLIMDEPTAVLTPQEAEQLFVTLRKLSDEGCAILYISHRLEEVRSLCHDATILRAGRVVANVDPQEETAKTLAQMMVGNSVHQIEAREGRNTGETLLHLENVSVASKAQFGVDLHNIDLSVCAGEIVAIAGVAGNGQSELFDVLSGETILADPSAVQINGVDCGHRGIKYRRSLHAAFAPEERLGHGAVPSMRLSDNVVLTGYSSDRRIVRRGIISRSSARSIAADIAEKRDVRVSRNNPEAESLSGGNLQKFIVGRELERNPRVLVVNQPTWGVDAGAAALIRQSIVNCADNGSAVLMISQDLDEVFEIADRVAVISRGQLSDAEPTEKMSYEKIGLLMAGAHEKKLDGKVAS